MHKPLFALIAYILSVLFLVNLVAHAQKDFDNSNVSIILAIDGSGSMKKTDPQLLRKQAAQLFTNFLVEGDQVGVIEFSSKIKTIQPLTTITSYQDIEDVKESLNALNYGGDTRMDLAIEDSISILKDANTPNKAIILLSDGALDVNGSPETKESKAALGNLLNQTLSQVEASNIKIFSIGLIDQKGNKNLLKLQRDTLGELSKQSNGRYFEALNAATLHKSFIDIIQNLIDPPQINYIKEKNSIKFFVDSKVKRLNIVVDKTADPQAKITLKAPDKTFNKEEQNILLWNRSSKYDLMTILPSVKSGMWGITSNNDINKLLITILADSDVKISPPLITGKLEQSSPITVSARVLGKNSNKESYKPYLLSSEDKVFCHITKPDNTVTVLPMILSKNNSYIARIVADKSGIFKVFIFTEGSLMRRSQEIAFNVIPEPPDEPKIILDQSVYAIGETIRVTIDLKNKNVMLPESFLSVYTPDNNLSEALKIKKNGLKITAMFLLKKDYKPGEYTFVLDYIDPQMKQKQKEAIAYVIGNVIIATENLDFGLIKPGKKAPERLQIKSDLKLTTLPLKLELSKVKVDSEEINPTDLLFYYPSEFTVQGEHNVENISLSIKSDNKQAYNTSLFNKNCHGIATFVLYSDQNEILNTREIPISFVIPGLLYNNILIIVLGVIISAVLAFLYRKKKKK